MAGDFGWEGGIGLALRPAPQPRRFAPAHRRGRFSFLYISKEIGARLRAGVFRAATQAAPPPVAGFPLLASAKLLAEGAASRKKNGRPRARPPSARAIPSATAPGRFSLYIYREICLVATVEDALGLLYRTRQLAHGDAFRFRRAANLRLKE